MKHVALLGKSRSGKDTVAQILVREAAYTRLAFADRLKETALRVDPLIWSDHPNRAEHLSEILEGLGWELTKDAFPEIRRFLQEFGQAVREMDSMFWVRPVIDQVEQGSRLNMPCVVTDVRYANEVEALRKRGAVIVRVERPGAGLTGDAANHSSETELDDVEPDAILPNGGTLDDLYRVVRDLCTDLLNGESE